MSAPQQAPDSGPRFSSTLSHLPILSLAPLKLSRLYFYRFRTHSSHHNVYFEDAQVKLLPPQLKTHRP